MHVILDLITEKSTSAREAAEHMYDKDPEPWVTRGGLAGELAVCHFCHQCHFIGLHILLEFAAISRQFSGI